MSMSMLASKLTVFPLMLHILKIRIRKKIIFVFGVVILFYFFSMDDLTLYNMSLILDADINVDVSIETYMTYDK
jgi:hypothetical protein